MKTIKELKLIRECLSFEDMNILIFLDALEHSLDDDLSDEDMETLIGITYNMWLKDSENLSVFKFTDVLADMIRNGKSVEDIDNMSTYDLLEELYMSL